MSGEDETPSGHSNALIALSRRLRTVSAKELPIVERGVLLAVAGRAGADWIAFPPVEWVAREAGTTPNTARRALDWLVKVSGWLGLEEQATPRTSARYRIRVDPVPPAGVTERYPSTLRGRGAAAAPQGRSSSTPGVTELDPRGAAAAPVDHRKIPDRSQKDPNARPRARAGGENMALFPSSESSSSTAKEPGREKPPKPAKPPREKPAGEGYADAFVQAFRDRGRTVSRPTTSEITALGKLCRDHALDRDHAPLVGAALPVWIRAQALAMLDGVEDFTRHRGGASVHGLKAWLDANGPVRVRELEPQRAPRPLEPEPPPREPPGCEDPDVRDRMTIEGARLLPGGPDQELIDRVTARMAARHAQQAANT